MRRVLVRVARQFLELELSYKEREGNEEQGRIREDEREGKGERERKREGLTERKEEMILAFILITELQMQRDYLCNLSQQNLALITSTALP